MYKIYWNQLRAWTYASWGVVILGYIVGCLLSHFYPEAANSYLVACWIVAFGYTRLVIIFFGCPRCGRRFFMPKGRNPNIFARRCMHCGLPKWASDPA
jgi:hypothetical protein